MSQSNLGAFAGPNGQQSEYEAISFEDDFSNDPTAPMMGEEKNAKKGKDTDFQQPTSQPTMTGDILTSSAAHPIAAFFHFFFKVLAVVLYIILRVFASVPFTSLFIVVVTMIAFDFWTVKNVSGRLLVGLRWWNEIGEDGKSVWVFESLEGQRAINSKDSFLFWVGLFSSPFAWMILLIFESFFKIQYLLIIATAVVLNLANIIGYIKCAKNARERVQKATSQVLLQTAGNYLVSQAAQKI